MAPPFFFFPYLTGPPFPLVSLTLAIETDVDFGFLKACVDATDSTVTVDASDSAVTIDDNEHMSHLLASYKAAITDFYGSETPCIYKTGTAWPVAKGQSQNLVRAARPIYNHGIAPIWLQTVRRIVALLASLEVPVKWNTIDPLAYANAGQASLFCDFVVVISVNPRSLAFEGAKAAAEAVNGILEVSLETRV